MKKTKMKLTAAEIEMKLSGEDLRDYRKLSKDEKKDYLESSRRRKFRELRFSQLREANVRRCEKHFHKLSDWTATDWACALAGEVGELCNFIKKARRGQKIPQQEFAKEIADIQCYLDLLAAKMGIDLAEATINKFNEVSDRKKSKIKL